MCGITGIFGNSNGQPLKDAVGSMTASLLHRGPDDDGVWVDATANLALGHRRLSILDLSQEGHQPMLSQEGRYAIAFNGEIYNHLELRQALEQAPSDNSPLRWRGHSDTETLLACFSSWGVEKTLERSVGMFAIALWDRLEKKLYLARDRFGEKPLYYGWVNGAFVFGSELKALRQVPGFSNSVDRNALALYTRFNYIPAPYSIFKDIFKVSVGFSKTFSVLILNIIIEGGY